MHMCVASGLLLNSNGNRLAQTADVGGAFLPRIYAWSFSACPHLCRRPGSLSGLKAEVHLQCIPTVLQVLEKPSLFSAKFQPWRACQVHESPSRLMGGVHFGGNPTVSGETPVDESGIDMPSGKPKDNNIHTRAHCFERGAGRLCSRRPHLDGVSAAGVLQATGLKVCNCLLAECFGRLYRGSKGG